MQRNSNLMNAPISEYWYFRSFFYPKRKCNLDIANMDFEECVKFKEGNEGEWFTYNEFLPHDNNDTQKLYEESASQVKEKSKKAIADLEEKEMA